MLHAMRGKVTSSWRRAAQGAGASARRVRVSAARRSAPLRRLRARGAARRARRARGVRRRRRARSVRLARRAARDGPQAARARGRRGAPPHAAPGASQRARCQRTLMLIVSARVVSTVSS
jgi:hypothetical protein